MQQLSAFVEKKEKEEKIADTNGPIVRGTYVDSYRSASTQLHTSADDSLASSFGLC
jgi:hypothetical protein